MAKKPAPTTTTATKADATDAHPATVGEFKLVGVADGNPQYVNPASVTAIEGRAGNVTTTIHLAGGTAVHVNAPVGDVNEALFG